MVVSTGAPKVAVPSVLGDDFEDAKSTLEGDKYEFVVKKVEEVSSETEGTVTGQDPELGEEVEKGSTITLTVAKAQEQSTVPDVAGSTCDEAKARMTENDLVGECTEVETQDPNQVGKVITTTPSAGQQADAGSKVNIQIGKAPANTQVQVPQIQGQKLKDAKKMLEDAGLVVGNITGSPNDDATVFSLNPTPGTTVNQGQTVDIVAVESGDDGGNGNGGIFGGVTGTSFRTED